MKRTITTALVLTFALSSPLLAQSSSTPPAQGGTPQTAAPATPEASTELSGEVQNEMDAPEPAPKRQENLYQNRAAIGLQGVSIDTDSSKFEEYRSMTEGLIGPDLRIFNQTGNSTILLTGDKLVEEDRRLTLFADTPMIGIHAFYDQIPHRLGNDAKSIETPAGNDAWGISDFVQRSLQNALEAQFATNKSAINYGFLRNLVEPLVNTPYVFDLGYTRKRAGIELNLMPQASLDTRVSYFQENRDGNRAAGTSFGFGNVVETAEPIEFRTRDLGVRLEQPFGAGLVRGGITVNQFINDLSSYTFDNPFRASDSTDASAYLSPGAASVNGARFGRMSLSPDSTQATANVGLVYKLPMNSRVTADVSYGRLQSSADLIAYTTNTAMTSPFDASDRATLPEKEFDGKINTTAVNVLFTTRPMRNLRFNARYRMYDVDNNSPRIEFPGYARFDAAWEPIERQSVPYGWKNQLAEVNGSYDLARMASLEAGFRHSIVNRTFRETQETTENMAHIAADVRPFSWLVARTSYEFGSRDYDEYDPVRGASASFFEEENQLPGLRRYDQAKRDSQRVVAMVQATPFDGPVSVGVNFVRYFDDYSDDAQFGLIDWRTQSLNVEADYTPSDRWSVFAFAGTDVWGGLQRGRQSGATFSTNPADNWQAYNTDKTKTWGAGANWAVIPDKFDAKFGGQVQRVHGRAQLESPPGGTPDLAFDVNSVDDTSFLQLNANFTYHVTQAWDVTLGAWMEHYDINDDLSSGTQTYMPGAFFLTPNDGNYQGNVAFVRTAFHW